MMKKGWAGRGEKFGVKDVRATVKPIAVLGAISEQSGLVEVLLKERSINSIDVCQFLSRVRERFG